MTYLLSSGFLYTSTIRTGDRQEKNHLKSREKAVSQYLKTMGNVASFSFKVTEGLSRYENNLLAYIDRIKDPSPTTRDRIQKITRRMLSYKTLILSLEGEAIQPGNPGPLLIDYGWVRMEYRMTDGEQGERK